MKILLLAIGLIFGNATLLEYSYRIAQVPQFLHPSHMEQIDPYLPLLSLGCWLMLALRAKELRAD